MTDKLTKIAHILHSVSMNFELWHFLEESLSLATSTDLTIRLHDGGGSGDDGNVLRRSEICVKPQITNVRNQFVPRRNQHRLRQPHEPRDGGGGGACDDHDDDDGNALRRSATGVRTLKLQTSGINSYGGGVSIFCSNTALQLVLGLQSQTSEINSYRGGISIAFSNRTSLAMVVVVVVVVTEMLFAALQLVSVLKLQRSEINSYGGGVSIVCCNRALKLVLALRLQNVRNQIVRRRSQHRLRQPHEPRDHGGGGGGAYDDHGDDDGSALRRSTTGVRTQITNVRNQFVPRRSQRRLRQPHEPRDDGGGGGDDGDTLRHSATNVRT